MRNLVALVLTLWAIGLGRDMLDGWIDRTSLPVLIHATASEIRDRNGLLLRAYTVEDGLWRMEVSPDQVDPLFFDMLIAYEDKRFYRHSGVDPVATMRAAWQGLRNGRIVSGASTLTMQVARLLEDGPTGQWRGKLRQIRLATALERRLSKQQILQTYLRIAPYGGNVEGLRAASLVWLGKEPKRLTPAEAALLVALPQSPETRRPDRNPAAAHAARDRVLRRMATAGVISADSAHAALRDPSPDTRHPMPMLAPHLSDRALVMGHGRHELTVDAGLQSGLEALARTYMTGRDRRLSLAMIVADHQTGEVLASVGSPSYSQTAGQGFVDMTQALRSPGSTLKPLVYGLAFDRGLAHPETLIQDSPVQFGTYAPKNFDGQFRGELRVSRALQLSLNIPVIRLTDAMGPAHLMAALKKIGLNPQLAGGQPGLAIALGGVGISLADLTALYATLANGGTARPLHWLWSQGSTSGKQILSPRAAWQVGHILAGLAPPPEAGPPGRIAYKTGTSYGHRDAWALGYDGHYVVGVWIGRPDGTPVPGAFGGDLAAPLLFEVLGRVRSQPVPLAPPPADTLIVGNALLPQHLQRFGGPVETPSLQLSFPPDGARLAASPEGIPVKLRGGSPPYTLLVNGSVRATGLHTRELIAPPPGPGFATLSVIDATGQSGRVALEIK